MQEVIETAAAQDLAISEGFAEANIEGTKKMGPYRPSSLIDFGNGSAVEIESIWGEPLRKAQELGIETPELESLYNEICDAVEARAC
jgi:2-dehydropantoate 2-reductase